MGLLKTIHEFSIGSIIRNMLPAILFGGLIVIILVSRDLDFVRTFYSKPEITVKQGIFLGIASLLPGALIMLIGERGLVDLAIIFTVIGSFLLSLYFMTSGKGFNAVITFLLVFPFSSLVEYWFNYVPLNFIWEPIILTPTIAFLVILFFLSLIDQKGKNPDISVPILLKYTILIFLLLSLLSSVLSINSLKSIQAFYLELICPLLFFLLVVLYVKTEKQIKILILSIISCAFLLSGITFYLFVRNLGIKYYSLSDFYGIFTSVNVSIGQVNLMPVFAIPLAFIMLVFSSGRLRMIIACIIGTLFAITSLSLSRAPIVSFIPSLSILLIKGRESKKYLYVFIIISILFFLFFKPFIASYVFPRFADINSFRDLLHDGSLEHRINGWEAAFKMIRDYPVLGIGIGLWDEYVSDYGVLQPVISEEGTTLGYIVDPHNYYLEVAVYSGVVAFVFFLGLLGIILREGFYVLKKTRDAFRYHTALGAISALVGMLTYFMFGGKFSEGTFLGVGFIFWSIVGIILKVKKLEDDRIGILR